MINMNAKIDDIISEKQSKIIFCALVIVAFLWGWLGS